MRFRSTIILIGLLSPLAVAQAQNGSGKGFLLGGPMGSFTVRGGWDMARAGSDVFNFTTSQLTLDKSDFSSPTIEIDFAFPLGARNAIVFSTSLAGIDKKSEFRHFIDNNDLPIEQTTQFRRVPITLGLRHYLTPQGRSIGTLAWIPARAATYVGVGGGTMWYRFKQEGDFIDFETNDVFPSLFESDGWTATAHGLAGVDYNLSARAALTGEARYTWSKAQLGRDFSGFQRIDLSGISTTIGLSVRF